MDRIDTHRAVVIGGSVAGLLTAHVLARHFARVTLLERDVLSEAGGPRKGVPQSRQLHGLLAGGRRALELLFPDFAQGIVARGARDVDVGTCGKFLIAGRPLPRGETGLRCFVMSRPLLESYIRERVLAAPNLELRQGCVAQGLFGDASAVHGVGTADAEMQTFEMQKADLVIDATGRGSRMPSWLKALGASLPVEERVDVNLHHVSFTIPRRPGDLGGDDVWIDNPHPSSLKAGAALAIEGDRYIIGLTGYLDEPLPKDYAGAIEFARALRGPDLWELLRGAEPLTELRTMPFLASQRRRYERLRSAPRGLLVTGDALCSFNSVYGQGMTVAAREAVVLDECLKLGTERLFRRFQTAAAELVDVPWSIVVGGDYAFEGVPGKRTVPIQVMNAYMRRLTSVAPDDALVSSAFLKVMHMCAPPSSLFAPDVVRRVLLPRIRASAKLATTPAE